MLPKKITYDQNYFFDYLIDKDNATQLSHNIIFFFQSLK